MTTSNMLGLDADGNQDAPSLVYVYQVGELCKIGFSRNLWGREWTLSYGGWGTNRPLGYQTKGGQMIACWPGDRSDETRILDALPHESHIQGEWFRYDDAVKAAVELELEQARARATA